MLGKNVIGYIGSVALTKTSPLPVLNGGNVLNSTQRPLVAVWANSLGAMMRQGLQTEAIVLNRSDFGESDRMVTLLTKDAGRLRMVALGARKSKRRFAGCLETFSRIHISFVDPGNGRVPRLEEATLLDPHEPIKSNLACIAQASYVAELSSALLGEGDDATELYSLLGATLDSFKTGPLSSVGLRLFEARVLILTGYAPRFGRCVGCGIANANFWIFDYDLSGVLCPNCPSGPHQEKLTPAAMAFAQSLLQNTSTRIEPVERPTMDSIRNLFARVLDLHIGQPLKSREFLYQLAKSETESKNNL